MADQVEDPNPTEFREQAILVAVVLVVLGILFIIFASAIAGGIMALLGVIFGLGSKGIPNVPIK